MTTATSWPLPQRIGFAFVIAAAAFTLGFAATVNPSPAADTVADNADGEALTRGSGQVINGCRIETDTNCPGANLRYAELAGADLIGANLSGADLYRTDLGNATLWHVDFSGATLRNTHMAGASLSGANLRDARLWNTNLQGADLSRADLTGADLDGATLTGANFNDTILPSGRGCSGSAWTCGFR